MAGKRRMGLIFLLGLLLTGCKITPPPQSDDDVSGTASDITTIEGDDSSSIVSSEDPSSDGSTEESTITEPTEPSGPSVPEETSEDSGSGVQDDSSEGSTNDSTSVLSSEDSGSGGQDDSSEGSTNDSTSVLPSEEDEQSTDDPSPIYAGTYYQGIDDDLNGLDLCNALNRLNSSKRHKTVGYKNMWNYYDRTDGAPGGRYWAFYSGKATSKGEMNKEHVWPDSRGGNLVEGDIHMPRPTESKDNSARGNSFFVEGMNHSAKGWDPCTCNPSWPKGYRGASARIIFYCAIANTSLTLVDKTNDSTSNKTMGRLSDLLKWHLENPVEEDVTHEKQRNEAAEDIQGNRNPFIDHPEYACRIWGGTNEETRRICANAGPKTVAPKKIILTPKDAVLFKGAKMTVKAEVEPKGASREFLWSATDPTIATISDTGEIHGLKAGMTKIICQSRKANDITATATVTVREVTDISLHGDPLKKIYAAGEEFEPAGLSVKAVSTDGNGVKEENVALSSCVWLDGTTRQKTLSQGTTSVICRLGEKEAVYQGITVKAPLKKEYRLVDHALDDYSGTYLIVNQDQGVALNGALETEGAFNKDNNTVPVSISGAVIKANATLEAADFTITKKDDRYVIRSASGFMIGATSSSKNQLLASTTTAYLNDLSWSSEGMVITAQNNAELRYNDGWPGFRYYQSGQKPVHLYRLNI